jgi:hypothetical protein
MLEEKSQNPFPWNFLYYMGPLYMLLCKDPTPHGGNKIKIKKIPNQCVTPCKNLCI